MDKEICPMCWTLHTPESRPALALELLFYAPEPMAWAKIAGQVGARTSERANVIEPLIVKGLVDRNGSLYRLSGLGRRMYRQRQTMRAALALAQRDGAIEGVHEVLVEQGPLPLSVVRSLVGDYAGAEKIDDLVTAMVNNNQIMVEGDQVRLP